TVGWFGGVVRRVQNGYLYSYAFWIVIGLAALLGWFLARARRKQQNALPSALPPDLAADCRRRRRAPPGGALRRGWTLAVAARRHRDTRLVLAAARGLRYSDRGLPVRGEGRLDSAIQRLLRARRRWHLAASRGAHGGDDHPGDHRRLDGGQGARRTVLRCLPDHGGADDRGVLRHRRAALLFF